MKELTSKHIFEYEPDKYHLIFIDKTGAASGKYMKALKFRQPEIHKKLKENLKNKPEIGDLINIKNYMFFVGRKHYLSKWDLKAIEKNINNKKLKEVSLKSLSVDYSDDIINIIDSTLEVEWRTNYEWGIW